MPEYEDALRFLHRDDLADMGITHLHVTDAWMDVLALQARRLLDEPTQFKLLADERPLIASVFLNRLEAGIALYADPTVQFAITEGIEERPAGGWWKRELTIEDLAFDSSYNTYIVAGLPPGPIASPGLGAILAVLRPASTDYLYFVAKGDGSHAFAETLAEHEANVERYIQP